MKKFIFEGLDVILFELINFFQEIDKHIRPESEKDEELKDSNLPILTFFEVFSVNVFILSHIFSKTFLEKIFRAIKEQ